MALTNIDTDNKLFEKIEPGDFCKDQFGTFIVLKKEIDDFNKNFLITYFAGGKVFEKRSIQNSPGLKVLINAIFREK